MSPITKSIFIILFLLSISSQSAEVIFHAEVQENNIV